MALIVNGNLLIPGCIDEAVKNIDAVYFLKISLLKTPVIVFILGIIASRNGLAPNQNHAISSNYDDFRGKSFFTILENLSFVRNLII